MSIFSNKNILVTGGTGSIGSGIVRKLLQYGPKVIRIFSNDEDSLFYLREELQDYTHLRFLVGDVRDKERLAMAAKSIDFIFHAAALKHVPLCEYNPFEAVKTNVLGTQNVIDVAMEEKVEKVITISTDKAVNPINVMGATKLLAERLTTAADYYVEKTAFSCVRFGNVLDSRGSALPLFEEQIKKGGPVTITNPDMTRFVMTIPRAVELVLKAMEVAKGGEIFIFKMPALRVGDLAEAMIEELAPRYGYEPGKIKVKIIGKRLREKDDEELMTEEEAKNAYETEDMFIISGAGNGYGLEKASGIRYSSGDGILLTKEQVKETLGDVLHQRGL